MTANPAISIEGVSKEFRIDHEHTDSIKQAITRFGRRHDYENFRALDDVSLDIPKGSVFGLIGANGSGKSTLLKCIARILTPDTGAIRVEGRLAALLELGTGFHPELTGRENVYLNASILGLSRRDVHARFDEIVEWSELGRFIDNPIKTYSSGMTVRLGFAVATSVHPEVLLVDEVLSVGDMNFRRTSSERMQNLITSGATIVLVAHDLGSVATLCDRAASLENGRVRRIGDVGDVIDDYRERMEYLHAVSVGHPVESAQAVGAIRSIATATADGSDSKSFAIGESMQVRVIVNTDRLRSPAFVAITLRASDRSVVSFNSSAVEAILSPGMGEVAVDANITDPPLGPGVYDWTAALRDVETRTLVDRQEGTARMEVLTKPGIAAGGSLLLDAAWAVSEPAPTTGRPPTNET